MINGMKKSEKFSRKVAIKTEIAHKKLGSTTFNKLSWMTKVNFGHHKNCGGHSLENMF